MLNSEDDLKARPANWGITDRMMKNSRPRAVEQSMKANAAKQRGPLTVRKMSWEPGWSPEDVSRHAIGRVKRAGMRH